MDALIVKQKKIIHTNHPIMTSVFGKPHDSIVKMYKKGDDRDGKIKKTQQG